MDHALSGADVATLTRSHEVPDGSMPLGGMKEELSKSYVHMLASACGLTLGSWGQDYDGKDASLSSRVNYAPDMYAPQIDIQLKCTGQIAIQRKDTIAWSLESRTYEMMACRNRHIPTLLCVLVIPKDVGHWIKLDKQGMLARCHMYWQWGHRFAPFKEGQENQTVHLPRTNLLTPQSLLELMKEASQWVPVLA
ncbi:DUF4365 domain-containing protein [Nocardia sp. NPDC051981]|uniref:DUF4365 domain-containing protein n=1 Tax=Nocardia sp. NPDC051981 TaxID=3155417 RepID=UPI003425EAD4